MNLVKTAEICKMGKINSAKKTLFGELMGNVMNLLKIFSLIVSSSPFIVKLYEFKPKLFQNIV